MGAMLFIFAVIVFYYLQNQPQQIGGAISLPKACWLGLALFYWYFLPPLLLVGKRGGSRYFYAGLRIFFALMLLRAVSELYLMYGNQGWHYQYGIAYNVVALGIVSVTAWLTRQTLEKPLQITLLMIILMFIAEIYFAAYMVVAVKDGYENTIWFIDGSAKHWLNNSITSIMVVTLLFWQIIFYFRWIRQES